MNNSQFQDAVEKGFSSLCDEQELKMEIQGDMNDPRGIGIWLRNQQIGIFAVKEYESEWVEVHSLIRPRPRAHLRSYSVSRLDGYISGKASDAKLTTLDEQIDTLLRHKKEFLSTEFLNSEELRLWNADAARIMFGEEPRYQKQRTRR